jgi:hypothetical protein
MTPPGSFVTVLAVSCACPVAGLVAGAASVATASAVAASPQPPGAVGDVRFRDGHVRVPHSVADKRGQAGVVHGICS